MPELAINAAFSALFCMGLIAALAGSQSDTSASEQTGAFSAGLCMASASLAGLARQLLKRSSLSRTLHVLAGAGMIASTVLFWKFAPGGEVVGIIAVPSFAVSVALQFASQKPFRSALISSSIAATSVILFVLLKEKPDRILSWELMAAWVIAFLFSTPLSVVSVVLTFGLLHRESRT